MGKRERAEVARGWMYVHSMRGWDGGDEEFGVCLGIVVLEEGRIWCWAVVG